MAKPTKPTTLADLPTPGPDTVRRLLALLNAGAEAAAAREAA